MIPEQAVLEVERILNQIFKSNVSPEGREYIAEWWTGVSRTGEARSDILASADGQGEVRGLKLTLLRLREDILALEPAGAKSIGPDVLAKVASKVSLESQTRLCDPITDPEVPEPESVSAHA